MTARDVVGRYRGSLAGLLWSFFNPVMLLLVYTFVFSVVFRMRWSGASDNRAEFALIAFSGMVVHSLFAECINRAPTLVLGSPNLVKKVVFPLEVLPWTAIGSALFHTAVSIGVLLGFIAAVRGSVPWTAVYAPLVLAPFVLFIMGFCWWLASIGVYVRDVAQTTGLVSTVLMFLSPVFYPAAALPEQYRAFLYFNPLTFVIEQMREVLVWGRGPDWTGLAGYALFALAVAWAGLYWFQRTRRGFADVL
jgi:lipopolysaccharide transport system permease protein